MRIRRESWWRWSRNPWRWSKAGKCQTGLVSINTNTRLYIEECNIV